MFQESLVEAGKAAQALALIGEFVAIGGTVFTATKGFSAVLDSQMKKSKVRKHIKFWFSQLLGPALGLLIYKMGALPIPGDPLWSAIGAAVLGWVGTLTATWFYLRQKRKKKE
jgi:hypothetical protein